VIDLHLRLDAKEHAKLQPAPGGFGGFGMPGGAPKAPAPGSHRNTFGVEFRWAKGELSLGGKTLEEVGLRYKGNFTFIASRGLKKSFKIDLARHREGQTLDGLKTLNLNCGLTDLTGSREALAYAFFRAAGVPAPRTAFAELTLTIPSKYDKEYVGVYTLIEQVDKRFLRRHFKDGGGMLLKPEGLQGGLQHLGNDWKPYADRYRPRGEPTEAQKRRLVEFTRLINAAPDARFEKEVGSFLDVDAFLRFLAANALLSNLDSFLAFGHNYFLYLRPGDDRFVFIPWDLDLSLAAWPAGGTPEQQLELSVMHPHAGQNRLIDRLLALKEVKAKYRKVLEELTAGPFTTPRLLKELDAVEAALKGPMEREKKAVAGRKEETGAAGGPFGGAVFGASLPPRAFFERRPKAVAAQLAGTSKGFVPAQFGFGPPGGFAPPPRVGDVMPRPVQDRLKLTPEQKRQMAELQEEVEEKIRKLLTEEQLAEWKRIRGGGPGPKRP
jgi:spore coat protein CotH